MSDDILQCNGFNVTVSQFDCPKMWESCPCPDLEADPDIAGIGVVVAFIGSSFFTVVSTLLYLLLLRSGLEYSDTYNPFDRFWRKRATLVVDWLRQNCRLFSGYGERIQKSLLDLVQSMADTQLVTGLGILIAGIMKLHQGSISVYHFSIVTNLAWLSSNTHLLSLLVIRTETLGSMKPDQRRKYKDQEKAGTVVRVAATLGRWSDLWARIVLMLALAGMLLYCSWIQGWEHWDDNYHCPANCAIGKTRGGEPLRWLKANFFLIIWSYLIRCFQLWRRGQICWIDHCRHKIVDNQSQPHLPMKGWQNWSRWVWYFLASEFLEVVLDGLLWFTLGITGIIMDWIEVDKWAPHVRQKELNVMGFGQLVPLFLVGLPFVQALNSYCSQCRRDDVAKPTLSSVIHMRNFVGTIRDDPARENMFEIRTEIVLAENSLSPPDIANKPIRTRIHTYLTREERDFYVPNAFFYADGRFSTALSADGNLEIDIQALSLTRHPGDATDFDDYRRHLPEQWCPMVTIIGSVPPLNDHSPAPSESRSFLVETSVYDAARDAPVHFSVACYFENTGRWQNENLPLPGAFLSITATVAGRTTATNLLAVRVLDLTYLPRSGPAIATPTPTVTPT